MDNIDGSLTYATVIAGEAINYSLKNHSPQDIISEKYVTLSDLKDSLFIQKITPKIRIETSIVVFSILHNGIDNREDL